jgi:hypothetical protein
MAGAAAIGKAGGEGEAAWQDEKLFMECDVVSLRM